MMNETQCLIEVSNKIGDGNFTFNCLLPETSGDDLGVHLRSGGLTTRV